MRTYKRVRLGERKGAILLGGQKFTGQAGNPLLNNLSKAEIERSLTEFMSGDSKFNNAIRKHLFQRLKYATGNLLNSLKWKAKVNIDGVGNDFSVSVGVYLTNPELIDALLSGKELEDNGARIVPNVEELVDYIHAKKKYYTAIIRDKYAAMLNSQRKSMASKKTKPFSTDPVYSIAEEIRHAMLSRYKDGKSPTKGSEYVLTGYYKIKDNNGHYWKPAYKKMSTPLYSINDDSGEINQEITMCLQRFWNMFFDSSISSAVSKSTSGMKLTDILDTFFPSVAKDKTIGDRMVAASDKIWSMIDVIEKTRKSSKGYSVQEDAVKSMLQKLTSSELNRINVGTGIMLSNTEKQINSVLRDIERYSLSLRKCAARRRR
jgi:hypothetical protein